MTMLTPMAEVIRVITSAAITLTHHNEKSASFHTEGADVRLIKSKIESMDDVVITHADEILTISFNCEKACKRFVRTLSTFTKFKTLSDGRIAGQ